MSYEDYEAHKAEMERVVPQIATELGEALESAPPEVKGAFFIVAGSLGNGMMGLFGGRRAVARARRRGLCGLTSLFNSTARDAAFGILRKWMVETFDWYSAHEGLS